MEGEHRMDAATEKPRATEYTTPPRVQAWFLGRSRDRWKKNYMELKAEWTRLQRRLADMGKSREKWRDEAEQLRRRVKELELQTAALQEQAAAFKKHGPARRS
jgi:predicted RNase H-like nuclease (RuvC/YqgF family)